MTALLERGYIVDVDVYVYVYVYVYVDVSLITCSRKSNIT